MKKIKTFVQKHKTVVVSSAAFGAVVASSASRADMAADITAAFTAGNTNLGLVATGVVGLAAVVTAITLIVRFLAR